MRFTRTRSNNNCKAASAAKFRFCDKFKPTDVFIRSGCGTFLIEMPIFRGGPVTVDAVPLLFGLFEMRRNPK
jgi:hypothetical protein